MCIRDSISVVGIRGNVDTRLRKMEEQQLDGIVLAAAGLKRLQVQGISYEYFPYTSMIPACGQGALAIEVKEQDATLLTMINACLLYTSVYCLIRYAITSGLFCVKVIFIYGKVNLTITIINCFYAFFEVRLLTFLDGHI